MHPALSLIVFSAASGAGYGLLFLLGLVGPFGLLPAERGFGLAAFALAFGLVTLGLVSSLFHLGHPERAWRALTQWRSSWLSREGVMALVTYVPAGLYAIGWVFLGRNTGLWGLLGVLAAAGAAVTVYCTGMIYASLRTIPRWHSPWTVPTYLALALMTGALWLDALTHLFGLHHAAFAALALAAIVAAGALKWSAWRTADEAKPAATIEGATGLGHLGRVRLLEAPHTEENYLTREMGYRVARKHAAELRLIAVLAGLAMPLVLILLALVLPRWGAAALALLAALSASAGVLIERWLFFAEAKHSVTLYYGATAV